MSPTTPPAAHERRGRRRLLLRAWAAGVAAPLVAIVLAGGSTPPRGTLVLEHGALPSVGSRPSPARAANLTEPAAPGRAVVAPAFVDGHGAGAAPAYAVAWAVARRALPDDVLGAYWLAVQVAPAGCHLPVTLLMAVGQVESGNLVGRRLDASHRPVPAILGPVLDGSGGRRAVADTDAGRLDGNVLWDRAVGPLQLVPASWRAAGVDLDGDGRRDPQDVYDAAGAAMVYFCAGGRDLATAGGLRGAVLAFNHSRAYLGVVLRWKGAFDGASTMSTSLRAVLTGGSNVAGPTVLAAARPSAIPLGPAAVTRSHGTTRTGRVLLTSPTPPATRPPSAPVTTPPTAPVPSTAPVPTPPAAPVTSPSTPPSTAPPEPPPEPAPSPPGPPPPPAPVPPPAPTPVPPPPPTPAPPPPPPVVPTTCPTDPPPVVPGDAATPPPEPTLEVQPTLPGVVPSVPPECAPPPTP